jgi:hypothetical protein
VYFLKGEEGGQESYEEVFRGLVGEAKVRSTNLRTQGRNVLITESVEEKSIARLNFWDMCGKSKGAADYLVIGEHFETIFISDVPKVSAREREGEGGARSERAGNAKARPKALQSAPHRPQGGYPPDKPPSEAARFRRRRTLFRCAR